MDTTSGATGSRRLSKWEQLMGSEQFLSTLLLIGLSITTSVLGQTAIKVSVSQPHSQNMLATGPLAVVQLILQSPLVLVGLALYGVGALAWIVVLSRWDLSYAYPFLALNFVLIALVSRLVLGESIPPIRWAGIAFICAGIVLISRGGAS